VPVEPVVPVLFGERPEAYHTSMTPDNSSFVLECSDNVVEDLRRWTLTADLFPPERGVLWGHRDGHTVLVTGVSPLPGEAASDQYLSVGWFQIRLGSDISLTPEDLLYTDQYFPQPGAVALILSPAPHGSVRAGVFFRELDGRVRADSSYQEVNLPGATDTWLPALEPTGRAPLRKAFPETIGHRRLGLWTAFLTGALAGAICFAAIPHEHAGTSVTPLYKNIAVQEAQALTEQNQKLQSALANEQIHNRRLEATLVILRDRLRPRSLPRHNE
jgi:hypothetical protein